MEWGKLVKENNGVVLAIDSWVGDLQGWFSESWREAMAWEDGQTHSYQRFLNRMVQNGLSDTVIPLRTQSITGARMLYFLNYTVDLIYLDGAQVLLLSFPESKIVVCVASKCLCTHAYLNLDS